MSKSKRDCYGPDVSTVTVSREQDGIEQATAAGFLNLLLFLAQCLAKIIRSHASALHQLRQCRHHQWRQHCHQLPRILAADSAGLAEIFSGTILTIAENMTKDGSADVAKPTTGTAVGNGTPTL